MGAALPLLLAAISSMSHIMAVTVGGSLACLTLLGGLAARVGGARLLVGAVRVTFWGAFAMALTAAIGSLFGTNP